MGDGWRVTGDGEGGDFVVVVVVMVETGGELPRFSVGRTTKTTPPVPSPSSTNRIRILSRKRGIRRALYGQVSVGVYVAWTTDVACCWRTWSGGGLI